MRIPFVFEVGDNENTERLMFLCSLFVRRVLLWGQGCFVLEEVMFGFI